MKIQKTPAIAAFFQRCLNNLANEHKNDFIDLYITKESEFSIQQKMAKAGFQEFNKENWPSLFISTKAFINSPYHKNIHLDKINNVHFSLTHETIKANYLFNTDAIQPDANRELNDWMILRALDEDYQALLLYQDDQAWMIDAPSESNTIDPLASKAFGKVLTFGLGIGYFVYMACLNVNVTSITVVERSIEVINMFNSDILPQIPNKHKINIIKEDAFNLFNEDYLDQFDYVFVDIWQSNHDGLKIIERLLMQYNPPVNKIDFWIEFSCLEVLPALIFMYFYKQLNKKYSHPLMYEYSGLFTKITKYFKTIDEDINDVNVLKNYMYDIEVLRAVLANK